MKIPEEYIDISTDNAIIKHVRKSLLFIKRETWMKKDSGLFDVAMGALDGAEVCAIVGNFLLNYLKNTKEIISFFTAMMNKQFLGMSVDQS